MIDYTRDDLDLKIKLIDPPLEENANFTARRDLAYKQHMAEYAASLRAEEDPYIIANTYSLVTKPSTGTEKVNTAIGDAYGVSDLPADFDGVRGDTIWIKDGTSLKACVRTTFDEIILSGASATVLSFTENVDAQDVREILIYEKEGEFTAPADVHFEYFREIAYTLPAANAKLDIKPEDFQTTAEMTAEYMKKNL